ncbi:MAG: hypothetical protein ABI945_10170 [Nitrospirales bacterium]
MTPASPKRARTPSFPSKAAGKKTPEAYRYLTRPSQTSQDRLFPLGYVEDFFDPRMQRGKGRV